MDIHDSLYLRVNAQSPYLLELWEPEDVAVVIGYGQTAGREVHMDRCRSEAVPVIRRRGGGGAVVLMPGVLCMTVAFMSQQSDSPYYFFNKINQFLIDTLSSRFGIQDLSLSGISDIAISGRKILGCSMFKSRNLYFYQGSLLVHPDLARIERYLQHPSREPDYRQGRGHGEFVTSLRGMGYQTEMTTLVDVLSQLCGDLQTRLL
jgi:lipoate-protein ligase A